MALNLYGITNYSIDVPLTIEYAREAVVTPDVINPHIDTQFRYTRHATKSYKYKGMTEEAARQCLIDKRIQYARPFMYWTVYGLYYRYPEQYQSSGRPYLAKPPYVEQVAQFNMTRAGDAPVYDLGITVDETVALYSTRDYDPNTLSAQTQLKTMFEDKTILPLGERLMDDVNAANPRYMTYIHKYDYDENLTGDKIVS